MAMKVADLLDEAGIEVVLTREDDNVPDAKMKDLNERIELINTTKPTITVCIHQNSYTSPDIKGAQVFYYTPSEEGKAAATIVQEYLREVDPENTRQIKANDTYYMLKNVNEPIIIVECGFLTNPEEAAKLTDSAYQDQLAMAVCEGIIKWLDK